MSMLRAFLAGLGLAAARDEWAVLVAGSNTYDNYRHQADVCHAYHILTSRGFDADKIIVMAYDDIAHDPSNPFPGQIFNYPWKTMKEAVDVYKGCKIDYKGTDVTPEKFIAVLTGNATAAGGKVLRSKDGDHVFVNFVDHGATGIIAFPNYPTGQMTAKTLTDTLKSMHAKKMYGQLTFYLEACESGSMFEGLLPADLPVYATTAANADESSWGTYCGDEAVVAGKDVGSCLGDLYSVMWMQDSDNHSKTPETLQAQYERVKNLTDMSHVMQYGQKGTFGKEFLADFFGKGSKGPDAAIPPATSRAHSSRDISLHNRYREYLRTRTATAAQALHDEIRDRQEVQELGQAIDSLVVGSGRRGPDAPFWDDALLTCHDEAVTEFSRRCGWSDNRLVLARTIYDACVRTTADSAPVMTAIGKVCGPKSPEVVV